MSTLLGLNDSNSPICCYPRPVASVGAGDVVTFTSPSITGVCSEIYCEYAPAVTTVTTTTTNATTIAMVRLHRTLASESGYNGSTLIRDWFSVALLLLGRVSGRASRIVAID